MDCFISWICEFLKSWFDGQLFDLFMWLLQSQFDNKHNFHKNGNTVLILLRYTIRWRFGLSTFFFKSGEMVGIIVTVERYCSDRDWGSLGCNLAFYLSYRFKYFKPPTGWKVIWSVFVTRAYNNWIISESSFFSDLKSPLFFYIRHKSVWMNPSSAHKTEEISEWPSFLPFGLLHQASFEAHRHVNCGPTLGCILLQFHVATGETWRSALVISLHIWRNKWFGYVMQLCYGSNIHGTTALPLMSFATHGISV